jgi:hypothetical protein
MSTKPTQQVLTVNQVAEFLGVKPSSVQKMTRPGNCLISYFKVGKEKRFWINDVFDFIEANKHQAVRL